MHCLFVGFSGVIMSEKQINGTVGDDLPNSAAPANGRPDGEL